MAAALFVFGSWGGLAQAVPNAVLLDQGAKGIDPGEARVPATVPGKKKLQLDTEKYEKVLPRPDKTAIDAAEPANDSRETAVSLDEGVFAAEVGGDDAADFIHLPADLEPDGYGTLLHVYVWSGDVRLELYGPDLPNYPSTPLAQGKSVWIGLKKNADCAVKVVSETGDPARYMISAVATPLGDPDEPNDHWTAGEPTHLSWNAAHAGRFGGITGGPPPAPQPNIDYYDFQLTRPASLSVRLTGANLPDGARVRLTLFNPQVSSAPACANGAWGKCDVTGTAQGATLNVNMTGLDFSSFPAGTWRVSARVVGSSRDWCGSGQPPKCYTQPYSIRITRSH